MTILTWPQVPPFGDAKRLPYVDLDAQRQMDDWRELHGAELVDRRATEQLAKIDALQLGDIACEITEVLVPLMVRGDVLAIGRAMYAAAFAQCRRIAARELELDPDPRDDELTAAKEAVL